MTIAQNPILPGCYPDPSICRVGEDFYLVSSTFEYLPGLPVHRSRDLVNWELVGHAIDRPSMLDFAGLASSSGLYAPTIRHHDGLFWLICTLVDQRHPERGGHFLLTAAQASGPWSDPIWIGGGGIDPSLFFDDDGRAWVHATRPARSPEWDQQTEVWLRELDLGSLTLSDEEHVIWSGAVRGAVWAEGPHLYKVDGEYVLLAAEGGTAFHHAVVVAKSSAITGPYIGNRANPVLTHRHLGQGADIAAVGHADLVQAVDGSWWSVLLATRPTEDSVDLLGRETFVVPVLWEDGWPVFAPGEGRVPSEVDIPFLRESDALRTPAFRSGPVPSGDPRWCSVRALPSEVADRQGDAWLLPLRPERPDEIAIASVLAIRQQDHECEMRASIAADLRDGEEVGFLIRQSERDQVRLSVTAVGDDRVRVSAVHRRNGIDVVLGESVIDAVVGEGVDLAVRMRRREIALLAGRTDADLKVVAEMDPRPLAPSLTGAFVGTWHGVYATSNGQPSDTAARLLRFAYVPC